ncbi:NAP1-related protein 2-like isoform X1 [Cynara cardunculus var. scolymus]|uniref:NAP1-related protein 2-like isoform X1 n=2 Tax=Cynara cardunculus var. scolymus TaxID=59895 RepID=UPI000D62A605|nr:NAP1-related protein 2-like isoform X1 [Cynara cardunculus var. scolymus]
MHQVQVNEEASDKVLEIEQHYNGKRRPVYVKRNQIIKTIPDFWLTAFMTHPALGDFLTDEDEKIFKYIDSLDVEYFNDVKSGYFITFEFKPNPYFEDTKLVKTIAFCDEGTMKITGTNIKWKEGMGSANGVDHGKTGNKRPAPEESFFSWFSETHQKEGGGLIRDEVAEIIKEDLWPNPLKYFGNDADEEPSLEDEDEEEGNDGEK